MANQPKNNLDLFDFVSHNRWLILTIGFVLFCYLLSPILAPFLIAAVLAYICDPLVDALCRFRIHKLKCSRTLATVMIILGLFLIITALVLVFIPLLQKQSQLISQKLPLLVDLFHSRLEPWLKLRFGVELELDGAKLQQIFRDHWQSTGGFITNALKAASNQGLALIGIFTNLLLIPIVLFYLLRDWDKLIAQINELIPRKWIEKSQTISSEINAVVSEFLRGQLSVMLALSIFYSLGLWLAGLEMALSIGLLAGLLSFVPFVGFALAFVMSILLGLLQFSHLSEMIPILVVFGIGQMIESYLLTPYLVGDRIGLHPVVVILALLAGGQLFGFTGVLIALPVSAAISVGLKHLKSHYLLSSAYLDS